MLRSGRRVNGSLLTAPFRGRYRTNRVRACFRMGGRALVAGARLRERKREMPSTTGRRAATRALATLGLLLTPCLLAREQRVRQDLPERVDLDRQRQAFIYIHARVHHQLRRHRDRLQPLRAAASRRALGVHDSRGTRLGRRRRHDPGRAADRRGIRGDDLGSARLRSVGRASRRSMRPAAEGRDVSALIDQVLTGRPEIAVDRAGHGGQPHYGNDHRSSNSTASRWSA